jgi:excisionase family DNA binding protein
MPSLRQAAKRLDVHHATLRRWILMGEGPKAMVKPNGKRSTYRITEADLQEFIERLSKGGKQYWL